MVGEIRIYIEGGGDGKETKRLLRRGFAQFLDSLCQKARSLRIDWRLVPCGGREAAFAAYRTALRTHPTALNILLVDAEAPVAAGPWQHLESRDGWDNPGVGDEQCQLMVQTMEAWIMADRRALREYYGAGFQESSLPGNPNVEAIPKETLAKALERATRHSSKGEYRKIKHASDLLCRLDEATVRGKAPHCDRLFDCLGRAMAL